MDRAQLDNETLARWVYKEEGWGDHMEWNLAGKYRDGRPFWIATM